MLADTVEAACHTLDNPTSPRLEKFITILITQKMDSKQLDNCDLTFRDISGIKAAFVNLLTGYYHNRIKYQNQQDPDDAPAKTEEVPAAEAPKEAPKAPATAKTSPAAKAPVAKTTSAPKAVSKEAPKTSAKKEKK